LHPGQGQSFSKRRSVRLRGRSNFSVRNKQPSPRFVPFRATVIELRLVFSKYLQKMATPGGRLIYGIFFTNRPVFVAVTLDQENAKVFRLVTYAKDKWSFACRSCNQFMSIVDGIVPHLSADHPKTPCRNQIEDALASIRLWAAFRANEEVKASGNPTATFTAEDWNRWLHVAGCQLENLSEDHWQLALRFVYMLDSWSVERLAKFRDRIKIGENLVRYTNKFPTWNLRSEVEPTPANETPTLPRRKKKKLSESSQEEPLKSSGTTRIPPPQIETIDISGKRLIHYIGD
jgi:hypothetical protein